MTMNCSVPKQLGGDNEGAKRVVRRATAGITDHVRVPDLQAEEPGGLEPGVDAGQDCQRQVWR